MRIVRENPEQNKPKSTKPKYEFQTEEYWRKWRLEFIASHNAKIQKMKDNGTYDKWLNKG